MSYIRASDGQPDDFLPRSNRHADSGNGSYGLLTNNLVEDASKIKNVDISKELCLPPVKRKSQLHHPQILTW